MKKMVMVLMAICLINSIQLDGFADDGKVDVGTLNKMELRYDSASDVSSKISISNGIASYFVVVEPRNSASIGYIEGTLKLLRTSTGSVTKTTRGNMYASAGVFKLSDTKTLTTGGEYHVEYVLKVYKSGKLVETITGKSQSVKY